MRLLSRCMFVPMQSGFEFRRAATIRRTFQRGGYGPVARPLPGGGGGHRSGPSLATGMIAPSVLGWTVDEVPVTPPG